MTASYADAIERAMYNGVLPGLSLSGTRFFYVNPLQRRTRRAAEPPGQGARAPWYPCACCPPNLMRLLSSWQQYLASSDDTGVQLHQYASADLQADLAGGPVRLSVRTGYPWHGRVTVRVVEAPAEPWTLSLRVPGWCRSGTLTGPGGTTPLVAGQGTAELSRAWKAGEEVVLELDLAVRVVEPDPRVDAVRGCVAVERGPLVYCLESADLPPGSELEELRWDPPAGAGRRAPAGHRPRRGRDHGSGGPPAGDRRRRGRPDRRRDPVLRLGQPRGGGDARVDPPLTGTPGRVSRRRPPARRWSPGRSGRA